MRPAAAVYLLTLAVVASRWAVLRSVWALFWASYGPPSKAGPKPTSEAHRSSTWRAPFSPMHSPWRSRYPCSRMGGSLSGPPAPSACLSLENPTWVHASSLKIQRSKRACQKLSAPPVRQCAGGVDLEAENRRDKVIRDLVVAPHSHACKVCAVQQP